MGARLEKFKGIVVNSGIIRKEDGYFSMWSLKEGILPAWKILDKFVSAKGTLDQIGWVKC